MALFMQFIPWYIQTVLFSLHYDGYVIVVTGGHISVIYLIVLGFFLYHRGMTVLANNNDVTMKNDTKPQ